MECKFNFSHELMIKKSIIKTASRLARDRFYPLYSHHTINISQDHHSVRKHPDCILPLSYSILNQKPKQNAHPRIPKNNNPNFNFGPFPLNNASHATDIREKETTSHESIRIFKLELHR